MARCHWLGRLGLVVLWGISSCASHNRGHSLSGQEEFHRAQEDLQRRKFGPAVEAFKRAVFLNADSELNDDTQYGLARTYYLSGDHVSAASEYSRLIREHPGSPYAEPAQFELGMCYARQSPAPELDQDVTARAREAFQVFLFRYPRSTLRGEAEKALRSSEDRMARKEYENGRLYLRMKEYEPARVYFELVSTEYAQTVWAARAQYAIGESYEQEGKIREAVAAFEKLISEFGQDPMAVRARERIERLGAHRGG